MEYSVNKSFITTPTWTIHKLMAWCRVMPTQTDLHNILLPANKVALVLQKNFKLLIKDLRELKSFVFENIFLLSVYVCHTFLQHSRKNGLFKFDEIWNLVTIWDAKTPAKI